MDSVFKKNPMVKSVIYLLLSYKTGYIMWHSRLKIYIYKGSIGARQMCLHIHTFVWHSKEIHAFLWHMFTMLIKILNNYLSVLHKWALRSSAYWFRYEIHVNYTKMEAHLGKGHHGDHLQIFFSGSLEKQSLTLFPVYYDNFWNLDS